MVANLNVDRAMLARNGLLSSLGPSDVELLGPLLEATYLDGGKSLSSSASDRDRVYFPVTMVACLRLCSHQTGISLIGREGMIGWPATDCSGDSQYEASVLLEGGAAFFIPRESMRRVCDASPTLTMHLVRFFQRYTLELSGRLHASSRASLKQRLSSWLLMIHDRVEGDLLQITHDALAAHLAVRRASITDALHLLEEETSLKCERGLIFVRDRGRLKAAAGAAYVESARRQDSRFGQPGRGAANPASARSDRPAVSWQPQPCAL